MTSQPMNQSELERTLFRYTLALEAGDLDTLGEILALAEADPELDRLIMEVNDVYRAEEETTTNLNAEELVRRLLHQHIPSAFLEEVESPPLTVGDVASKIQADAARRRTVRKDTLALARQLQNNSTEVPTPVRLADVQRLLKQLGIAANTQFEKLFQDAATFLLMGRGQSLMAATRRQKKDSRRKPPKEQK